MKTYIKVSGIIIVILISLILLKYVHILVGISFFVIGMGLLVYYGFIRNNKNKGIYSYTYDKNYIVDNESNYIITFIIPTIGRKTLGDTINSLRAQTNSNWKAIIIFDGIKSNININDFRIKIMEISKTGIGHNSAGLVRNIGLKCVDTKWVGFVDDDDTLSSTYVSSLLDDIKNHPNVKTIIFRMISKNGIIYPYPDDNNFYINKVGISFAVNTNFYKTNNLYFKPSSQEDYYYLDNVRKLKVPILISSYVTYFVSTKPRYVNKYKEVYLNY